MSVRTSIKQIHNISRPGEPPADGDVIEVEGYGGFVKQVDPYTYQVKEKAQRFRVCTNGSLSHVAREGGQ